MPQLLVRNIDDALKEELKESARENGRSLEAEARERLRASVGTRGATSITGPDAAAPLPWRSIAERARHNGFTAKDVDHMDALRRSPLVLDDLDDDVRTYWEERALANGNTLGEEVHALLTEKARWLRTTGPGLGSAIANLFKDSPFEGGEIEELPLRGWQYPDFDEE